MKNLIRMYKAGNGSRALVISYVVYIFSLALLAVTFVVPHLRSDPWRPLYGFTEQHVLTSDPNLTDGHVDVSATKCYKQAVFTVGTYEWKQVSPITQTVKRISTQSAGAHHVGCINPTYRNPFPAEVIDAVNQQLRATPGQPPVFVITGQEQGIRDGRRSEPVTWSTEPFTISERP